MCVESSRHFHAASARQHHYHFRTEHARIHDLHGNQLLLLITFAARPAVSLHVAVECVQRYLIASAKLTAR
jgi:hypothetical protein